MTGSLDDLLMRQPPTAERPLLGIMVLLVEDSRYVSDALRLICHRSGARIRRAESIASATRHLRAYRPRVAIVDLGLPDGSGLTLIRRLAMADQRIDAIIAISGDSDLAEAAIDAGADIFLPKPLASISAFQSTVLGLLPDDARPDSLSIPMNDRVCPDPIALRDDLSLAVELLSADPDEKTMDYVSGFLNGLGQTSGDMTLAEIGHDMAALKTGQGRAMSPGHIAKWLQARIGELSSV